MSEIAYKNIIDDYLENKSNVNEFINSFISQWRDDRDKKTYLDDKFQRLVDRLFTTCDCYSENPENSIEITEAELRKEVDLFRHIWFG